MSVRIAALAACMAAACAVASPPVRGVERLGLDDAIARVDALHPDLRLFGALQAQREAERDQAALAPALTAGATLENALGSGRSRGLSGAELTLTLAAVFERGGKLDARRVLAQSRIDALAVEREGRRLDLLAEVARRYLAAVGAQGEAAIARTDIAQRTQALAAAERRLRAGASPEAVVLAARAALAQAELGAARAEQHGLAARQALAALWGERGPSFELAPADPLALPAIAGFDRLAELIERTPEIARFADERRIGEARLRLARTEERPDASWQIGVRRLQADGDVALVGGVSIPLGAARRAAPGIRAAEAELGALEIEREARALSLYATLADAHGRYRIAQLEVERLQRDVVPLLVRGVAAAERAYAGGAASYLELAQIQSEHTRALMQRLQAALAAQQALIEIQRLTGQSALAAPTASGATP
ncbi:MAG: TolC family protein [Rhodanobacter denitrificans]|uniref:TolC family protein n=1 Tax=Rhodanobacter denitrificans TaxID=666685 RepID=A0A2W5LQE6_9GAMM|nr:MAG: TolC family protein [Rhodanobacter denitrificans]